MKRGTSEEAKVSLMKIALASIMLVAFFFTSVQIRADVNQRYPDVVDVKVQPRGANEFDFDVTISSPYDSPERYADAFRVMSAESKVYGERKLLHDHANEQPFTRDLYGVLIPPGVRFVIVQGRDKKYGYGGRTARVTLPGR